MYLDEISRNFYSFMEARLRFCSLHKLFSDFASPCTKNSFSLNVKMLIFLTFLIIFMSILSNYISTWKLIPLCREADDENKYPLPFQP